MERASTEKQAEYLYPRVLEALDNKTRRAILKLLPQSSGKKLAFSEIKDAFPGLKSGSLSYHLKVLQMADMVARTVELEQRRKNPDLYYCFYSITAFGQYINQAFPEAVKSGVAQLLKLKEEE